jgi:hypothetical protein
MNFHPVSSPFRGTRIRLIKEENRGLGKNGDMEKNGDMNEIS